MNVTNTPATLVGDREIVATRILNAPRELVFSLWTDPKHIGKWWGPKGFTTTTFKMDVKPGGVWRFVMHGPDGRDYENKITYLEVVKPERIVYKHGDDIESVNFHVTATFEAMGGKTKFTWRAVFPTAAERDKVVKEYGAVEGMNQNVERLEEQLTKVGTPDEEFVISREFDAPRDVVWKAWTERDRLMQWFGPKGFVMTVGNLDFRPEGTFHYCMRTPDGKEMWGKFIYREIIPPQRIVWTNTFSDKDGNLTRHPFNPVWPQQMLTTTTFAEHEGKTTVTVRWVPINASELERTTFHNGRGSMTMGWTGTFDQFAAYLAKA